MTNVPNHHHRHSFSAIVALLVALALGSAAALAQPAAAERPLEIVLNATGMIVDGTPMDSTQLEARLRTLTSKSVVLIHADEKTDVKQVTGVMDLVRKAGVTRITLRSGDAPARAPQTTEVAGISFDFPGGTVAQLLETIRKNNSPIFFNLVGTKEQLALPLPAFSLRSAGSMALASALDKLLQPNGATVELSGGAIYADSMPIFVIRSIPQRDIHQSAFDCFSLAPLLDRYTPEQIAGAIQTAWELDPNFRKDSMRLKYHPETQLLFVVGNSPQPIAAASQIYKTLLQQKAAQPPAQNTEKKP